MNEIKIFENEQFGKVRTVTISNEPWFVGKDVADILGYKNGSRDINTHVDQEDQLKYQISTAGQMREQTIINESGLYSLILGSKLPTAKEFKRWITHDVLPSIRKNGMYMTGSIAQQAISNPDEFLARAVIVANERLKQLEADNEVMKPKADYFDDLVDRNTLVNFRDCAKEFHLQPKQFIDWLIEKNYVYRDVKKKLKPYAEHKDYFHLKEWKSEHNGSSGVQTLITPKGREAFRLLLSVGRE